MSIKISIVASMYNRDQKILQVIKHLFLPSLISNASKDIELILIDDCSPLAEATDKIIDSYRYLLKKKFGYFKYIKNRKNLGFAGSYNRGLKLARGELIVSVNDDVYFPKNSIKELCKTANSDKNIGVVGPVTNHASSFQSTNLFKRLNSYSEQEKNRIEKFALWLKKVMGNKVYSINKIIGFCVVYKKSILKQTGYFDTKYEYGNFEDDNLHLRIKNKGCLLILDADIFVEHGGVGGGSMSVSQHPFVLFRTYLINTIKFGLYQKSLLRAVWRSFLINPLQLNNYFTLTPDIIKLAKQKSLLKG